MNKKTNSVTDKKTFVLPLFLNEDNRYTCAFLLAVIGFSFYLLSNHFSLSPARVLSLTALDNAVPFVPQTVWIYNSDMLLFFVAYIVSKNLENANKYLYSFSALLIISITIFFCWPVAYPRDLFPLPASLDPWTASFFKGLRSVDTPANCLPSLHVSSSYLSSFIYLDEQKKKFPFFFGWATVIAISTLTTKQHYIIDVVTGLGLAILVYLVFRRARFLVR